MPANALARSELYVEMALNCEKPGKGTRGLAKLGLDWPMEVVSALTKSNGACLHRIGIVNVD